MLKRIWSQISRIGIDENQSMIIARKAILTNQLAFITFSVVFIMNFSFLFIESVAFDPLGLVSSFIILTTPLLNKYGHYKIAAFIFVTLMPISLTFFSAVNKTLMPAPIPYEVYIFPKFYLLSFLVLPLILIDSRSKWLLSIAILINLSCLFFVDYLNQTLGVGLDFNNVSFATYSKLNLLITFPIAILIFGFIFLNNINNKAENRVLTQNTKLETANNKIEKINNDLTKSILYAQRIQNALLPEQERLDRYFKDVFIYYKPQNIVSGDFYFLKETKIKEQTCVALICADCTGHGVPGGFMSVLSMSILNDIIRDNSFNSAADILDQLRILIKTALNQTGKPGEQRDGIELSLILYYPHNKSIEFSGARNPIYIIKNNDITVFKGDAMPIGIYLNENAFTNQSIELEGGETIYMFTDGITDQMNARGNRLMTKNLRSWLLDINKHSGLEQEKAFSNKMHNWMKTNGSNLTEQIDDMLLIGFKIPE